MTVYRIFNNYMVTSILKVVEMMLLKYITKGGNPSRKQCIWRQITGKLFCM